MNVFGIRKNRGVILVSVLLIIFLLSLMVWSMARRSSVEVSSLEYYQGKLRSYAAARAGVNYILNRLTAAPTLMDNLYEMGIVVEKGKSPESIFSHIDVGKDAYAIVEWNPKRFALNVKQVFGLEDEGGKININAINSNNFRIIANLFEINGLKRNEANDLALRIASYNTSGRIENKFLLKDNDQEDMKTKHKPFEYLEELLDIGGMTVELYNKIKEDLTVLGDASLGLTVNVNTANNDVIRAIINAAVEFDPSIQGEQLINQAYALRDGADGVSFTLDDGKGAFSSNLEGWPVALQQGKASFIHAHVVGVDSKSNKQTEIDVIFHVATQPSIVGWHRN